MICLIIFGQNIDFKYCHQWEHKWNITFSCEKMVETATAWEVVMTVQFLQDASSVDCELTGSWSADGMAALFDADTTSQILGSLAKV